MKLRLPLLLLLALTTYQLNAQAPCVTSFTGFDPCSAEPLGTASTCVASQEVFQTNTCAGMLPTTGGCAMTTGTNIVWGSFTVVSTDTYTITWTASNNRNIRLGLYQFTDICLMTGETQVACANAGGNGVDETISQVLTPGQYFVCGKSSGNLSNASTICIHAPSIPAPVVASDCGVGVNVCTNLNFSIDPNGEGINTNEIPVSGSLGNPFYNGFTTFNPWGTLNLGCLQIDESNSTWMKVNISGSGNLEFVFGGNNTQTGYYDWIMYPATADCADVLAHTVAPTRCNWNLVDFGGTGLSATIPVGGDAGNFEPPLAVTAGDVYIICFSNFSSIQSLVPLNFGGTAGVSCTPLPVEFLTLTATVESKMDSKVNLTWATVSENNNDYFEIQRKVQNGFYESIGEIDGHGTTTDLMKYLFEDENAIVGEVNYYRIKQVDFDGAFDYSTEVSVMVPRIGGQNIYPNPNNGLFSVQLRSNVQGDVIIALRDISGRVVSSQSSKAINGKVKSDFSSVPSGSYLIEVIQNEIVKTQARVVLSN
jgi:hypothetical protein